MHFLTGASFLFVFIVGIGILKRAHVCWFFLFPDKGCDITYLKINIGWVFGRGRLQVCLLTFSQLLFKGVLVLCMPVSSIIEILLVYLYTNVYVVQMIGVIVAEYFDKSYFLCD